LGASVDALGYLSYGFSAKLSAVLTDARYLGATIVDSRLGSAADTTVDISGNFMPRAPRLALAYGLSQTVPTSVGEFDWSLSGQTKSTMYMTPYNGEGRDSAGNENPLLSDVVPWTTRLDASVGYTRSEGDIRFDAFVANLTDATYMTSLLAASSVNLRFFNPPRQFGLRVSMYL
jgi:iron complex outermembrane recepter protein